MSRVLPILFNTNMVCAILDGRKTVTRRVIKSQPTGEVIHATGYKIDDWWEIKETGGGEKYFSRLIPAYQPGDILYARETYHKGKNCILYKADNPNLVGYRNMDGEDVEIKWTPSIHMPKEAARIWLKVTDVRVERLQDMPPSATMKEGIHFCECPDGYTWKSNTDMNNCYTTPMGAMKALWDSTIRKKDFDRCGWDTNPWVWVIEFERCEKPESEG